MYRHRKPHKRGYKQVAQWLERLSTPGRGGRLFAGAVFLTLLLSDIRGPLIDAQAADMTEENGMTVEGFTTRGTDEEGQVYWKLEGAQAVLQQEKALLQDVFLEMYPEDNGETVQMRSPRCRFDRDTGNGDSSAPLWVKTKSFRLSGEGYRIITREQKLHIKNNVRMVIKKQQIIE